MRQPAFFEVFNSASLGLKLSGISKSLCHPRHGGFMKKHSPMSRSGRFAGGPAADVAQFTESISFDWRLWRHDILGSMAHAQMLQKIGVLTRSELRAIVRGLDAIGKEIKAGKFKWNPALEDVHMNIEAELIRRIPA